MILDLSSNDYTSNTASISSTGVTVDSSINTGAGSTGLSLSTTSPTTLIFHFDTAPLTAQNSNAKFSGNLSVSFSVTLTSESENTSDTSMAITNLKQKASLIAQGVVNDADTHAIIIIKSVALVVTGAFATIVTLDSEIAPIVAGGA